MKRFSLTLAAALAATTALSMLPNDASAQEKEIRWGTSSVGSSGHRALVGLTTMLNSEWDGYDITVLPMPGAIATVRGWATNQIEGFYGADIAFEEFDTDSGRFTGFKEQAERAPVMAFWAFTLELGLGVRAEDADSYDGWNAMDGRPVFTGPAPWDTRAALERAMRAAGVEHEYVELDIGLAGSSLQEGTIDAFSAYTGSEVAVAPWVSEAELSTEINILNPTEEEIARMEEAGISVVRIDPGVFQTDVGVDEVIFTPLFYGFHLGTDFSENEVYEMLTVIQENADALAETDGSYRLLAEDMVGLQRRGIASSVEHAEIHPGLARFLRENDGWDSAWDDRIAE